MNISPEQLAQARKLIAAENGRKGRLNRWKDKTKEERQAFSAMLLEAKRQKKLAKEENEQN